MHQAASRRAGEKGSSFVGGSEYTGSSRDHHGLGHTQSFGRKAQPISTWHLSVTTSLVAQRPEQIGPTASSFGTGCRLSSSALGYESWVLKGGPSHGQGQGVRFHEIRGRPRPWAEPLQGRRKGCLHARCHLRTLKNCWANSSEVLGFQCVGMYRQGLKGPPSSPGTCRWKALDSPVTDSAQHSQSCRMKAEPQTTGVCVWRAVRGERLLSGKHDKQFWGA